MREPLRHGEGHDPRRAFLSPPSERAGGTRADGTAGESPKLPGYLTLELDVRELRSSVAEAERAARTAGRGGPGSQEPAPESVGWSDSVLEGMRLDAAEIRHADSAEGCEYLTIEVDEDELGAGPPWQPPRESAS